MNNIETSLLQGPFPVDLVEIGVSNQTSVLCVAKEVSKVFIAFKIVQEVHRKCLPGKITLIASENTSGLFFEKFTQAIELQTSMKYMYTVFTNTSCNRTQDIDFSQTDILITSPAHIMQLITSAAITWSNINLLIIDDCHLVTNPHHPLIMDHVKSHDQLNAPIIVGLTSALPVTSPTELQTVLDKMESLFGCTCSVSSDLVALNRYGEQPHEDVIIYSFEQDNDKMTYPVSSRIKDVLKYLADTCPNDENRLSQSMFTHLRTLFNACHKILKTFGLAAAIYNAKVIMREATKMEKKVADKPHLEALCYCKDQLNLILKSSNDKLDHCELNQLVTEIISSLWIVKSVGSYASSGESITSASLETVDNENTPCLNYIEKCTNENSNKVPISVILCQSDHEAAVLNFLLNKVAKSNSYLSCIKSAYISSSNVRQRDLCADSEEVDSQAILQHINEGQVNVLLLSCDVENEIYISSCKQLLRFGIPHDYLSYVKGKRILRAANGEVIFVETSENWRENGNQSSEVFREIECILAKRCEPCKFAVKDDAFWDEISSVSESKGKDVQPDEAKLAIALINRYCHSFPNDGFSSAFPCCHVKVMEEAESVSVVSRLYLPSHSPIYWPFQGSVVIPKEHATPSRIAIAHSESCVAAAVLACNTLHQTGELEKQGPRLAVNSFTFNKADVLCPAEVADGGSGKEGSNKRRRVYERKFPSVLMNNLPVAGTTAYLYLISITLSQPASCYGENVLAQSYSSSNMLGLLSRNHLPKVPKFIIYNKAIELTVSITEYANMVTLTTAELDFIQRCHQYVHTDIMYINGDSGEEYFHYEPEKQTYGFYVLPLDVEHKCEDAVEIGNKSIDCHNARFKVFSDELSLEALKIYGSVEKKEDVSTQVDASDEESDDRCGSRSSQRSRLNEFDNIYSSVEKKEGDVSTQVDASGEESEDRCGSRSSQRSRLNDLDNINSIKSSCAEAPRSIVAPSVAFDFLKRVDQELGNLSSSVDPSPIKRRNDFESFRGRVVTAIYMAKPTRYIVSDIVYDMNPLSAFPDPEVAATFSDYYKQRYGIDVHEEQPLLHVRHLPKIINSLAAKYRDSKGRDRPLPSMDSKRQKRARVLLIPELCSIHPIPAPLWQNILYIPSILHRLEAILLAEELRQVIAAETGAGSTEWPEGVELPLVTMGEDVGEYNELRVPLHVGSEEFNETNVSLGWQLVKSEILEDRPDNANETLVTSEEPLEVLSPRGSEGSNEIERSKDRQFKSSDTLVTSEEGPFLSKCKPLKDQPDDACSSLKTSKEILPKGGESGAIISSKPFQAQNMYRQPSSTLILKALTCNGAMDVFKHDRLEMYGDAFIKFAVSLNMYCESPLLNVGKLSFYRGLRVSNRQLFYLGRALDIPSYIFNITFQPLVTWCPHGFRMLKSNTPQDQRLKLHSADQELDLSDNEDDSYGEEKAGVTNPQPNASVEIDGQIHIVASDKMVADTTEAIIGAYLVTTGVKSTLGVMKWLGLDVADDVISESQKLITSALNQTCDPESVKKNDYEHLYTKGGCLLNNEPLGSEFQDMEATIGYSFKNKLLLLQAFTHMSYPRDLNHLHTSYEQLEFLGDALLDYLVTRHLYFTHRTMSPGALTDLRSAVVNSYSFAFLSVQHGFHKHLRSMSPAVFRVVNRFTAMQKDAIRKKMLANPDKIFSCVFVTPDDNDENNDSIEVPKVLADIFESVIGAVFIDSGMDVERTWLVVYHLLKSTFDHYADNLPSSPIRQLQEMLPNDVCFASGDRTITGRYSCSLTVKGFGKFKGTGRSLRIARSTAAQRALAHIQAKKESAELKLEQQ